jgi:hypothetical protein
MSSREQTRQLQIDLASLGYYNMAIDGLYGNGTREAVRRFQQANGLAVDGNAGSITRRAISVSIERLVISDTKTPESNKVPNMDVIWLDRQVQIFKLPLSEIRMEVFAHPRVQTVQSKVKSLANDNLPILAFNGGLFSGLKHMSYAKSNGVELTPTAPSMMTIGQLSSGKIDLIGMSWMKENNMAGNVTDAIGAYPTLVINGVKRFDSNVHATSFGTTRHPRLAYGLDDKHLYATVVHGRNSKLGHFGMTLNEMADLCVRLKLKHAINLDGGGSISVVDRNGNRLDKNPDNRPVKTMILIYPK